MTNTIYNADNLPQSPEKWADFVVVEDKEGKYWLYKDTGKLLTHPKYVNHATLIDWVRQGRVYMYGQNVVPIDNYTHTQHVRNTENGVRVAALYKTLAA